MKATQITHVEGLSGFEEIEALKIITKELQEADKLLEELDDSGCTDDEEEEFDEHNYLTSVAEGAGYEMDSDGI